LTLTLALTLALPLALTLTLALSLALTLALTLALALALPLALTLALTLALPLLGSSDTQATDTGDPEEYCDREPCPALADAMHIAPSPVSGRNSQPILDYGGGQDASPVFWRIDTNYRRILSRFQALAPLSQGYGTSYGVHLPFSCPRIGPRFGGDRLGVRRV
jgi:hypothetical protein